MSRPPVANDLFDDRPVFAAAIDEFPGVRYLAHRLRGLPDGTGLEEALERMLTEADPDQLLATAIAAFRFYLQAVNDRFESRGLSKASRWRTHEDRRLHVSRRAWRELFRVRRRDTWSSRRAMPGRPLHPD